MAAQGAPSGGSGPTTIILEARHYYVRLLQLGPRPGAHGTPFEFRGDAVREVPGSGPYITAIADAYMRERFGRRALSAEERAVLLFSWEGLRLRMLRRLSGGRWPTLAPGGA